MNNTHGKGKIHPLAQAIMALTSEHKDALAERLSQLPMQPPAPADLNPALHYLQVLNAANRIKPTVTPPPPVGGQGPVPQPPPAIPPVAPPAPPMAQPAPVIAPTAPTLTQQGQELGLADLNGIRQRNPYLAFGNA